METEKEEILFHCARTILCDGCPDLPQYYLCKASEFFDETACERCWSKYLLDVVNGRIRIKTDDN